MRFFQLAISSILTIEIGRALCFDIVIRSKIAPRNRKHKQRPEWLCRYHVSVSVYIDYLAFFGSKKMRKPNIRIQIASTAAYSLFLHFVLILCFIVLLTLLAYIFHPHMQKMHFIRF